MENLTAIFANAPCMFKLFIEKIMGKIEDIFFSDFLLVIYTGW